jgi:hypothetical protein
MAIDKNIKPNRAEYKFLYLAYNRFYDIFDEVLQDSFWDKDDWYRLSKIKEGFCVYNELLNYEPLKYILEKLKTSRPPMESEIANNLFRFIRNLLMHFPFFNAWDDIYITKELANWYKGGQSIDKFLSQYEDKKQIKYRFWEQERKRMTYLNINFPKKYKHDTAKFLKKILSEKDGVKFSFILMKKVLDTQTIKE